MKTIWKYIIQGIDTGTEHTYTMPKNAKFLDAQVQNNVVCFWMLVDNDEPTVFRSIKVFGTGHPVDLDDDDFLATVQEPPFVWHLFDKGETALGNWRHP